MPNMSYCRFQNTLLDLQDCMDNWDDPDLSKEEKRAREDMIGVMEEITEAERRRIENEEEDDEDKVGPTY